MRNKIILLLCLLSFGLSNSQTLSWVAKFGEVHIDNASDVAIDSNGNVYAVGFFKGSVDFDPSSNLFPVNFNSNITDKGNIYCVKLNSNGELLWVKQIGGVLWSATNSVENTFIPKIELDGNNNVYVSGIYDYRVDFDPSPSSVYNIPNPEMSGSTFKFVSKYDQNGNFVWAKRIGSNTILSNTSINNMKVDTNGDIYLAGVFNGTVDFDPGSSVYNFSSTNDDIFCLKLNSNGEFQWAKQIGSSFGDETISDISIDNQNLYLTGSYRGTVDFDTSINVFNLQSTNNSDDIYIAKYNLSNGNLQWAKSFGSPNGWDKGITIANDNLGNIYASGLFRNSVDFNPDPNVEHIVNALGSINTYLLKLNNSGEFMWVKNYTSAHNGFYYSMTPTDITVKGNQVFLTGTYLIQVVDGNNQPLVSYPSYGNNDIFLLGFDTNGNVNWAKGFGGSLEDISTEINLQSNYDLFLVGAFKNSVDFNPNSGTVITSASSNYDAFVLKLNFSNLLEIKENIESVDMRVFPNPSSSYVNINSPEKISKIYMYSSDGRLIMKKTIDNKVTTLHIENLKEGIYFLNIFIDSKKYVKKIIKN